MYPKSEFTIELPTVGASLYDNTRVEVEQNRNEMNIWIWILFQIHSDLILFSYTKYPPFRNFKINYATMLSKKYETAN